MDSYQTKSELLTYHVSTPPGTTTRTISSSLGSIVLVVRRRPYIFDVCRFLVQILKKL